jgi:hypothetical protein
MLISQHTLKTSLKIFYQEELLQEKLIIDFCILLLRRFNSKTSKMSICVWKYLRKTITSTTENNFHQEHRRLEEKLFKLQFVNKEKLCCIKTSGAWTFDPSTFWARRDFENSSNRHFEKKHLFPLIIEDNLWGRHLENLFNISTLRRIFPRHASSSAEEWNFTSILTTAIKFEATFHHHDLVKVVWRKIVSEKNLKIRKLEDFLWSTLRRFHHFFSLLTLRRISNKSTLRNFRMLNN